MEIPKSELIKKVEALKAMHLIIKSMNHEDAYYEWIVVVPDEPELDDFIYIAEDRQRFNEVFKLFKDLVKVYGKHGLYITA